jgi:hypothetical protein
MSNRFFRINNGLADCIKQNPSEKLTFAQFIKRLFASLGQYPFEKIKVAQVFKYRYASLNDGDSF